MIPNIYHKHEIVDKKLIDIDKKERELKTTQEDVGERLYEAQQ